MKTDSMETPTSREEFELRFHLLKNVMANDRLKVSSSALHGLNGIGQVRFLPNKRIDFLSVNESARLMANMMLMFEKEKFNDSYETMDDDDVC
jgi:hypothetical protein